MYPLGMRVVGRTRISRSTEESTSIERQREIIEQWANANGHSIVGWAEDVDVSGSVDPFDTPELGDWLDLRRGDWDVICTWKLDRLGRNAVQLNKLFGWCLEHGKTVVSASESIDLGTPVGRLIANVIAFLAEGELEAIRERVTGSKRKLRELGRWSGGKPPHGYASIPNPEGSGHVLVVDPVASTITRRIVEDVLDGKPIGRIVTELNEERYLTPAKYYETLKAGDPQLHYTGDGEMPQKWRATAVRNMLRSKALRGFSHHKGETVRDEAGMPVQLSEPLVTPDEWELLQAALDRIRDGNSRQRYEVPSLLSGIAKCIVCEAGLYSDQFRVKQPKYNREYYYRYYRCVDGHTSRIAADTLETLMEEHFLDELGSDPVKERVWVPGDSRETDLREALAAMDELTLAAGRAKSTAGRERLQRQLDSLDDRIADLESAPAREAHWDYRETGGTYRDQWDAADDQGRQALLRRSGITLAAGMPTKQSALRFEIRIPEALRDRMST